MKFWEWMVFISGMLSALAADDSVFWCLILGLVCAFSVLMVKVSDEIQKERRKQESIRKADFAEPEADSWSVRHVKTEPLPSNDTTFWEEWQ